MIDACALAFTFDADAPANLPSARTLTQALRRVCWPGGLDGVEAFVPHPEHARLEIFGDGPPPFAIVECRARSRAPLQALATDAGLPAALAEFACGGRWRAGAFRVVSEPVPRPSGELTGAPLALVVHYYGPVDDPAAFAAHYVAHHPALLARLPRIREVLCHVPQGMPLPGWAADPTVIRNEVRFDTMDDLLAALHSPAMRELRDDTRAFPRFGRSTHYPMLRLRVA